MSQRGLLTLDEAAAYLAVTPGWLQDAAQAGRLDRVRLGRQVRFTQDALDAFVARSTVPAAPAGPHRLAPGLPQPVGRRRTA